RGPADKRGINLKPTEVIVAIDGTELNDKVNVSQLLTGKLDERGRAEEAVVLQVAPVGADPKDPKQWRKVEIMPANRGDVHKLMYDRWVAQNAARVNELSKGKLGYIHIPTM